MLKKRLILIFALIGFSICIFAGCGNTPAIVSVAFYSDDQLLSTISVKSNQRINLASTPTKNGYKFEGWYIENNGKSEKLSGDYLINNVITSTLKVNAKWSSAITYSITYNVNSGEFLPGTTQPKNYTIESETIVFAKPTRVGFIFVGWYDNFEFSGEQITQIVAGTTGNIELYAKYRKEIK